MKKFILLYPISCLLLGGCTVSIIQTDTHGVATDVVDDTTRTDSEVDPNVSVPVKPI